MTTLSKRALFWLPRVLSIALIAFMSMFALDVFGEGLGFWGTLLALTIHLIPCFVLIAALVLAWRWEWIGEVLYGAAASFYVVWLIPRPWPSPATKMVWLLMLAAPALAIAALFLMNWLKRSELHPRTHAGAV